jgi:hypothetical protein
MLILCQIDAPDLSYGNKYFFSDDQAGKIIKKKIIYVQESKTPKRKSNPKNGMVMHDVDNSSFYMTRYHIYFFFTVE